MIPVAQSGPARILIVDDEPGVRDLLRTLLGTAGYLCAECATVAEALHACGREAFDLVLCDYNMPGDNGLELLRRLREGRYDAAFIMATAAGRVELAVQALTGGAVDFLPKPLALANVLASVERALDLRRADVAQRRRLAEIERLAGHAEEASLRSLAVAVDLHAGDLAGHSLRVGRYAAELARHLGFDEAARLELQHGFYLHDIGKLGISDAILNKPGPLTPGETATMRLHVQKGVELVRNIPTLAHHAPLVLAHHERFDGAGYPRGLRGEVVPIAARVFAVADTLDAMTSDRSYRASLGWEAARVEIERQAGRQFDPAVTRAFSRIPLDEWAAIRDASTDGQP